MATRAPTGLYAVSTLAHKVLGGRWAKKFVVLQCALSNGAFQHRAAHFVLDCRHAYV